MRPSFLDTAVVHFSGQMHFAKGYYFGDDFLEGGYSRDLALASESDPAAKFSEVANAGAWLVSITDGGSDNGEIIAVMDDEPGGVLRITNNDADNDLMNLQLNGSAFKLRSDPPKRLFFAMRIRVPDVDVLDWFVGLAAPDTSILAGTTERVGFQVDAADAKQQIECVTEDNSTETNTDSEVTIEDGDWIDLAFEWLPRKRDDGRLRFLVNGVQRTEETSNIPIGDDLTPTIEIRNASAAANTFDVDWMEVYAER